MVIDVEKSAGEYLGRAPVSAPVCLADWEHAMQRAVQAARHESPAQALAAARRAAQLAVDLMAAPPERREDDCVAALVVSQHHWADLHLQAGDVGAAAERLAQVHWQLLDLLFDPDRGAVLQQAAWRHSRETHCALLRHLADHGRHPAISEALQAGALLLAPAGGSVH